MQGCAYIYLYASMYINLHVHVHVHVLYKNSINAYTYMYIHVHTNAIHTLYSVRHSYLIKWFSRAKYRVVDRSIILVNKMDSMSCQYVYKRPECLCIKITKCVFNTLIC